MKNILKTFAIAASVDKRDSVDTRSAGTGFICPIMNTVWSISPAYIPRRSSLSVRSYDIPRKSGR